MSHEVKPASYSEILTFIPFPVLVATRDQKIIDVNPAFRAWWSRMDGENRGVIGRRFSGIFKVTDDQEAARLFTEQQSTEDIIEGVMQPRRNDAKRLPVFIRSSQLPTVSGEGRALFCILVKEREALQSADNRDGLLLQEMRAKSMGKVVTETTRLVTNQLAIADHLTGQLADDPVKEVLQQSLRAATSSLQTLQRLVAEHCLGFGSGLQGSDVSAGLGHILEMRQTLFGNNVSFVPAPAATEIVALQHDTLYCTILDLLLAFVEHAGSRSRARVEVRRAPETILARSGLPRNATGYSMIDITFACGDETTTQYIVRWFGGKRQRGGDADQGEIALATRLGEIAVDCRGAVVLQRGKQSIGVAIVLPRTPDADDQHRLQPVSQATSDSSITGMLAISGDENTSARVQEQLGSFGFQVETMREMQVRPAAVVKNIVNRGHCVVVFDGALGKPFLEDVVAALHRRAPACGVLVLGTRPKLTATNPGIVMANVARQSNALQLALAVADMLVTITRANSRV